MLHYEVDTAGVACQELVCVCVCVCEVGKMARYRDDNP